MFLGPRKGYELFTNLYLVIFRTQGSGLFTRNLVLRRSPGITTMDVIRSQEEVKQKQKKKKKIRRPERTMISVELLVG